MRIGCYGRARTPDLPMNFEFNDEQKALQQLARRVAKDKVAPRAAELDETGEYPEDLFAVFRDTGLLGVGFPPEYEGSGLGITGLAIAVEETAKYCNSCALMLLLTRLGTSAIFFGGNDEQKRHYLPAVATGKMRSAFALTEPGAGSDSGNIRTTARRDGKHYVLTGNKQWISGATVADFFIVAAKTKLDAGNKGMSVFIVEKNTPGFRVGKPNKKMGVKGVPTAELILEEARVPAEALLGTENDGFKLVMKNLNSLRPVVAARGLGTAEGCVAYAVQYAKERETFGKKLIEHQAIQFMLAELAMGIEAARLLTYKAAMMVDAGQTGKQAAPYFSMAKAFATELANKAAYDCMQVMGSYGYSTEYPMERYFRDARQLTIVEGTSQIQRLIISNALIDGDLIYS
jgi:alkylation response protein AidB-like acyl-CoA dehydrogenase